MMTTPTETQLALLGLIKDVIVAVVGPLLSLLAVVMAKSAKTAAVASATASNATSDRVAEVHTLVNGQSEALRKALEQVNIEKGAQQEKSRQAVENATRADGVAEGKALAENEVGHNLKKEG